MRPQGIENQPLSGLIWRVPEGLDPADFNPNKVFSPEMRLLKINILECGWTAPIIITDEDVIIDGFHRWTLGLRDPDIRAMTGGLIPVVSMGKVTPDLHRMATVRHNRARGQHGVVRMAAIVDDLIKMGLEPDEISHRLEMDMEEVERLMDRGSMVKRRVHEGEGDAAYSRAWKPTEAEPKS